MSIQNALMWLSVVVDCLEHALGKNVARACAKIVSINGDETYLSQNLLRFVNDKQRVKSILQLLYRHQALQNGSGEYVKVHQNYTAILESQQEKS